MATLKDKWEIAKAELGLTDDDLLSLQGGAEQREKVARELGLTYKVTEGAPTKRYDPQRDVYAQAVGADQLHRAQPLTPGAKPLGLKELIDNALTNWTGR